MLAGGVRRAADAVRVVKRVVAPPPVILMYHRVAELDLDPQLLAVTPRHFAEQLDVLRRGYRVLSLADLVVAVLDRRVPRRAVVLTIDDGYADSLEHAKPALEQADAPATVFVATGQIGSSREFWWDELERLLLRPCVLPDPLRLPIDGSERVWDLHGETAYGEADAARDRSWHVEQADDPGTRQRLYRSVYDALHPLTDAAKWRALEELRRSAGAEAECRPTHRALHQAEVRLLATSGLVEVGAHSVTHPALGGLSREEQDAEVAGSKAALEGILGHPVESFAFPHGSYTADTVAAVTRSGFARAVTSDPHPVRRAADVLRLPRIVPRDWDGDTFAAWLRAWAG
jgi:peptidoglycan/xylan/chitin deacetylase (PgdA/CDA1 family)